MFFFPITKKSRARYALARTIYAACISQTRQKEFYLQLAVPDTFHGRFDLTSLHVGLIVSHLSRQGGEAAKLSQALFDEMFVNIDQTCREMGIGDLAVPRHMKRMMKAFKGRLRSPMSMPWRMARWRMPWPAICMERWQGQMRRFFLTCLPM